MLLRAIQQKVMALGEAFDNTYKELLIALARHNIFLVNENQLSDAIQKWLRVFFKEKVLRHIIPILLNKEVNPVKFLKDEYTYLAIEMKKNGQVIQYALVEVPTDDLPRFFQLPPEGTRRKKQIIILDNVIRFCLDEIFKGFFDYDEIAAYAVKLTRDAEYDLSDQLDLSLVDKMSDGLKQRLTAMPVRFVYEREMPAAMISFLKLKLQISSYDAIMPGGRYHNFKDFIGFPNVGRDYLENPKLPALDCRDFDGFVNAFDAITKQDILLYYPYHKFHHFTELVRQAAFDSGGECHSHQYLPGRQEVTDHPFPHRCRQQRQEGDRGGRAARPFRRSGQHRLGQYSHRCRGQGGVRGAEPQDPLQALPHHPPRKWRGGALCPYRHRQLQREDRQDLHRLLAADPQSGYHRRSGRGI